MVLTKVQRVALNVQWRLIIQRKVKIHVLIVLKELLIVIQGRHQIMLVFFVKKERFMIQTQKTVKNVPKVLICVLLWH